MRLDETDSRFRVGKYLSVEFATQNDLKKRA
jgi:hypothetical protein